MKKSNLSPEARWYRNKYGLTDTEARDFANLPDHQAEDRWIEGWRERHGFPDCKSPLVRGIMMDLLNGSLRKEREG